ncbi:MAG TPA: GNAT family N-acetyltransferase [Gemmatimonadaceae bacterium]
MKIRKASRDDADALASLLDAYLRESYPGHLGSTPEQLRRDVLGEQPLHHVLLAETGDIPVGFIGWDLVYDMHWATSGAQIADLFVLPSHRGLGVSLALVANVAAQVRALGGGFLRGGAYDRESTRRSYARLAVVHPSSGDTFLAAKAFRRVAELADLPIRDIIRHLPPIEWNLTD